ncbi:hypothetical protein [Massilia sp. Dwa41.01b]|uniref:hypothetical protein n=1 Tax=Massilia sp. Dwa41.01b TaxID=2709302 RepID=UPI001E2A88D3|nr:hypothetical protein [Massilia sp. Dwa41.01b]
MTEAALHEAFAATSTRQKLILGLLALAGEPFGFTRLREHLEPLGAYENEGALVGDLAQLRTLGLATEVAARGSVNAPGVAWPAIDYLLRTGRFNELREVYDSTTLLRRDWQGNPVLRSYRQGWRSCAWPWSAATARRRWRRCWRPACAAMKRPTCIRWSTSARVPSSRPPHRTHQPGPAR